MFIFLITYRAHGVQQFRRKELIDMLENIKTYFTPLKNSIRTADDSSTVLPDTDLDGAPRRGADSNLHWYKLCIFADKSLMVARVVERSELIS